MRKLVLTLALLGMVVPAAVAATYSYSWDEASAPTHLGSFDDAIIGACKPAANRNAGDGGDGLLLTKDIAFPEPGQAFLAAVWGLSAGDSVTVSYWRYDPTDLLPDARLMAHYNDELVVADDPTGQNMAANDGNCLGNMEWGWETGWEQFDWTWVIEDGHTGLVIDAWVYGELGDQIRVDDLTVTAPDHASVRLPDRIYPAGADVVPVQATTWTQVKTLFR